MCGSFYQTQYGTIIPENGILFSALPWFFFFLIHSCLCTEADLVLFKSFTLWFKVKNYIEKQSPQNIKRVK